MNYEFPEISHINDVLPAIKDSPEFIVAQKDGYQVINYVVAGHDTFPDVGYMATKMVKGATPQFHSTDTNGHAAIRRECRGLIFDMEGKLINRRYHKFFNVNEREETAIGHIDWHQPHYILEKLDGSMVSPCLVNGEILWMTKMGVTDTSLMAAEFVKSNPQYVEYSRDALDNGITPIFEWCSNKNRIVLDYPEDKLVLTALRMNLTGAYLPYERLQSSVDGANGASRLDIPVVRAYNADDYDGDIVSIVRELEDAEGVVVRFEDGHMVKIKSDWYVRIHKVKDMLGSEKDVVALVLNNEIDDLLPILPEQDSAKVLAFRDALTVEISKVSSELFNKINFCRDKYKVRKEFAIAGAGEIQPVWRSMIFKYFDVEFIADDVYNTVLDMIKNHCNTNAQYAKVKEAFLSGISY